jgi:predicted Ser/Thr protein kinase/tetratricopeptide (TPR) repeat protein
MDDKTVPIASADTLQLMCPTCGARYSLPKYVEGQKYGCKRCSASLMFGKFALLQELGRGGFGVVYKAWQADLQRVVALKFLHADSDESGERFLREARIAANLNHPNITAIYEVGNHEGKLYIAMQFVDGTPANKVQLGLRDAVMMIRDAALAVDYAHARDIIHRDLKPHNIMITQERSGTSPSDTQRRTFVMDFGLARSVGKGSTLTTEGQVMGTPAYMSPEQAEGKACDPRSDVYSLGASLYALVARRAPFEAPTPVQVLMQVTRGQFTPPSQINPEVDRNLEAIILKAMSLDPALRYPNAGRLAGDLTSWLGGGVTDAGPTVHLNLPGKQGSGSANRGIAVAAGLALILAGGGGLIWSLAGRKPQEATKVVERSLPLPPPAPAPNPPLVAPEIPAPPPAPTVLLLVKTDPAGAVVRVGSREWTSPVSLTDRDLSAGDHEVVLSREGYVTVREKVALRPGPSPLLLERKLDPEARVPAFIVDSEPRGAKVFLNGGDTGARTPHTVYRDELPGALAQVELDLDGFFPAKRSVDVAGGRQDLKVPLEAKTGGFLLSGAAPRSTVYLFSLPPEVRHPAAVAGLWSENPDQLVQALARLEPTDIPRVVPRLKDLAVGGDARVREGAALLAATAPSAETIAPERRLGADGTGAVRIEKVWIARRYRIFATSPRTQDFLSVELEPRFREELPVKASMTQMGVLTAQTLRPAKGSFDVLLPGGGSAGRLAPGGPAVRAPSGQLTLKYLPESGEAVLREFQLSVRLDDRFEVGGNLHLYAGDAFEREGRLLEAARCFAAMLDETAYPESERAERARLPERIRRLYRTWVEARVKEARPAPGDGLRALEDLRGKGPAETSAGAITLYAGMPALRGPAATVAAAAELKLNRPYEAMEWVERALAEKRDPADALGDLANRHSRHPGLTERYESALAQAEALRKMAVQPGPPVPNPNPAPLNPPDPAKRPGFLGLKAEEAGGGGARVSALAKNGPAQAGGLRFRDVITDFGAAAVRSAADLEAVLSRHHEGDEIVLKVSREGAAATVRVRLAATPGAESEWLRPEAESQLGTVQSFNRTLGLVFVKLDEGAAPTAGMFLEVLKDGQVVGEIQVTQLSKPDHKVYPFGSAVCKPVRGVADKGFTVRKKM